MKNGIFTGFTKGLFVLVIGAAPLTAQSKIVAVMDASGKVMFTNNIDNTPAVSVAAPVAADAVTNDPIHSLVEAIAGNHGVDPALVQAMIQAESGNNRWAVSSKGALGLMQLIPTTGARYGVRDFFDPKQNIEGGVRYMKFLLQKFNGNVELSLAAYNAGENLVERLGRVPSIPETRDYVRKVRAKYGKQTAPVPVATAEQNGAAIVGPVQPRQEIFRIVDERGIVHFSNVAPPK